MLLQIAISSYIFYIYSYLNKHLGCFCILFFSQLLIYLLKLYSLPHWYFWCFSDSVDCVNVSILFCFHAVTVILITIDLQFQIRKWNLYLRTNIEAILWCAITFAFYWWEKLINTKPTESCLVFMEWKIYIVRKCVTP